MTKADQYYALTIRWKDELALLRALLLSTELVEGYKWQYPVYMLDGKNVISIVGFKDYVGLWFFQGVFINDTSGVLQNAQAGKTKAMRQWRFHSIAEINQFKDLLKQYIVEAIQHEKDGKRLKHSPVKRQHQIQIPQLLQNEFVHNEKLKLAFESLSASCKREYTKYILEAKRDTTKERRMKKIVPMILSGKTLHDQYRR